MTTFTITPYIRGSFFEPDTNNLASTNGVPFYDHLRSARLQLNYIPGSKFCWSTNFSCHAASANLYSSFSFQLRSTPQTSASTPSGTMIQGHALGKSSHVTLWTTFIT